MSLKSIDAWPGCTFTRLPWAGTIACRRSNAAARRCWPYTVLVRFCVACLHECSVRRCMCMRGAQSAFAEAQAVVSCLALGSLVLSASADAVVVTVNWCIEMQSRVCPIHHACHVLHDRSLLLCCVAHKC